MKKLILLTFIITLLSCSKEKNISSHISDNEVLTPQLFLPGIISTNHLEFGMTISPKDAKTIYFTRRIGTEKQKIYETKYQNNKWSKAKIASFSTDRDESPHFSADGKTIYFGSERPIPNKPNKGGFDMNVWKTDFINGKWTTPTPLPETINKIPKEGEEWPIANMSDLHTVNDTLFYTGTLKRGEKGLDIYSTSLKNGIFTKLKKLPKEINKDNKWEYAPIPSYDGKYLFFQVYNRKDGFGGDDIFVTKKDTNGNWLPSVNLGKLINTNMNECPAAITSDGKYFFFTRDFKKNPKDYDGIPSIYFIETKALQLESLF